METLHMAAAVGNLEIVQFLVSFGINMNDGDKNHLPLHEAIMNSRRNVCEFLIDSGADVNIKNEGNQTMLHYAVDYSTNIEIAELLIDAGVSVNAADFVGLTPLHCATRCHWLNMCKLLCESGADPEAQDVDGMTPLHVAAKHGRTSCAHYLIVEQNVSLDKTMVDGVTAFALAVKYVNSEIAEMIVAAGYRPRSKDCSEVVGDVDHFDRDLVERNREKHESLLRLTRNLIFEVPLLQDMCVYRVRRLLGRTVVGSADCLKLPAIITDRIKLTHIKG